MAGSYSRFGFYLGVLAKVVIMAVCPCWSVVD